MFSARKKPQFTTTDVFPLTDAIMDFEDSAAQDIRLSRRELDVRRLPGQRTLLQKWLIAVCLLSLFLMVVVVFHAMGMVQSRTVMLLSAIMGAGALVFFLAFQSGLNRRFVEKRLKFPIVLCALTGMLTVFYWEPITQIAMTPFIFVSLAYGMYRIRRPMMYLLGFGLLAGYAGVVGLHYWEQQNEVLLRLELMHLLALGAAVPAFVFLIGKVPLLHHILHRANRKIKNIQEDAQRDTLLGCFNRRYVVAALEEQQQLADETGIPLCLAVIDLDHFKRVNDELGHLGGDAVLRAFAQVAQENVRSEDIFGRYGGEEFLLIFPATSLLPALNTCERIRSQVEAQAWKGLARGKVTVSIGVTQYVPGESVLEFFSRADTATYMAKEGGRNQVVVEEPTRRADPSATVPQMLDGDDLDPDVTVPTPLHPDKRYATG